MNHLDPNLINDSRQGFSAAEFGAMLGKSKSWTYRMLYRGKILAIEGLGALLIPRSELERLLADTRLYAGRSRSAKYSPLRNGSKGSHHAEQSDSETRYVKLNRGPKS